MSVSGAEMPQGSEQSQCLTTHHLSCEPMMDACSSWNRRGAWVWVKCPEVGGGGDYRGGCNTLLTPWLGRSGIFFEIAEFFVGSTRSVHIILVFFFWDA